MGDPQFHRWSAWFLCLDCFPKSFNKNSLPHSSRFYGCFSHGFFISGLIGGILNCLDFYHNVVRKKGGGVRRFYVFQIMNINLAAADTKEHPITAIVAPDNIPQGLKCLRENYTRYL